MPHHPDGRPWCPPGVGADASDEALVRALAAAWGTPGWVLDLAGGVLAELGLVAPEPRWIACDPAHRPGTAVDERLAEVTNCPYAVRLYVLPGRAATRPVRPRVLDAAHPLGVDCVLWAGPRAGLDAGAPRA